MRRGRLCWAVAGMGAGVLGLVSGAWGQTNVQDQYKQPTVTTTVTTTVVVQTTDTTPGAGVAPGSTTNPGSTRIPGAGRDDDGPGPVVNDIPEPGAGPDKPRESGGGGSVGGGAGNLPFTGLSLALLALLGIALLAGGLLLRASQKAAAARAR